MNLIPLTLRLLAWSIGGWQIVDKVHPQGWAALFLALAWIGGLIAIGIGDMQSRPQSVLSVLAAWPGMVVAFIVLFILTFLLQAAAS